VTGIEKVPRPLSILLFPVLPMLLCGVLACDELGLVDEEMEDTFDSMTLKVRTWARLGMDEVSLTDATVTVAAVSYSGGIETDSKTLSALTNQNGECSIFVSLRTEIAGMKSNPYYHEEMGQFVSMTVSANWENGVTAPHKGSHKLTFDPPYPEEWTLWMWLQQDDPTKGSLDFP